MWDSNILVLNSEKYAVKKLKFIQYLYPTLKYLKICDLGVKLLWVTLTIPVLIKPLNLGLKMNYYLICFRPAQGGKKLLFIALFWHLTIRK